MQGIKIDPWLCRVCVLFKTTKAPWKHSIKILRDLVTTRAVDGIHTGAVDSMKVQSFGKEIYIVAALDAHTRYALLPFVYTRNETAQTILRMIRENENLFSSKTSTVVSMNRDVMGLQVSNGGDQCVGYLFQKLAGTEGICTWDVSFVFTKINWKCQ